MEEEKIRTLPNLFKIYYTPNSSINESLLGSSNLSMSEYNSSNFNGILINEIETSSSHRHFIPCKKIYAKTLSMGIGVFDVGINYLPPVIDNELCKLKINEKLSGNINFSTICSCYMKKEDHILKFIKLVCMIKKINADFLQQKWIIALFTEINSELNALINNVLSDNGGNTIHVVGMKVDNRTFRAFISESRIVGCTGDGSFADCISSNKLPIYEYSVCNDKETLFYDLCVFIERTTHKKCSDAYKNITRWVNDNDDNILESSVLTFAEMISKNDDVAITNKIKISKNMLYSLPYYLSDQFNEIQKEIFG